MKQTLSFTLLNLFFAIYGFGQDTIFFDSKWLECDKSQSHFYRIDTKAEDVLKRTDYYTKSNQIQMQGQYSSLNPELKIGEFKWFHSNGKLKHIGNYENDLEEGEHIWYFDNGNIEAIENYKDGKLDGVFKEYYQNGKISIETTFVEGVQQGFTKYYRPDGTLHSEGLFKAGDRDGNWKCYDENGEFLEEVEYKTDYVIEEAQMFLRLPNSSWHLASKKDGNMTEYIFKRESITDSNGLEIIPAIMVYVEDASKYDDLILYSAYKQKPLVTNGIEIDEILAQSDADYPISYQNSLWYKCHYTQQGLEHIFYMVLIMNEEKIGIQVMMDMTKDISGDYESEFIKTLKSLKKL